MKSLLVKSASPAQIFEFLKSLGPLTNNRALSPENFHTFFNKNSLSELKNPDLQSISDWMKTISVSGEKEIYIKEFNFLQIIPIFLKIISFYKWLISSNFFEKDRTSSYNTIISKETLKILRKLLTFEMKNLSKIQTLFEKLKKEPDFNLYILFQTVSGKNEIMSSKNLLNFLRNQSFNSNNFAYLKNKLFGEKNELTYREFSLFFSPYGGIDSKIRDANQDPNKTNKMQKNDNNQINNYSNDKNESTPNLDRRRNTTTIKTNNVDAYKLFWRKNSTDYVDYLLKVRNTESKLSKLKEGLIQNKRKFSFKPDLNSFFFELFQKQLQIEKEIESLKEDLALKSDLSLKNLLKLFDGENKGFISINNIQSLCGEITNEEDLIYFIRRYAKSERNYLG